MDASLETALAALSSVVDDVEVMRICYRIFGFSQLVANVFCSENLILAATKCFFVFFFFF